MSWREELITNRDEAFEFIKRHLGSANLPKFVFEDLTEGPQNFAPTAQYVESDGSIDDERPSLFFFDGINHASGEILIDGFSVDIKGKGLGPMGFKALLGFAHEVSAHTIILPEVNRDGPSFWPALGAVTESAPRKLHQKIEALLKVGHLKLDESSHEKLLSISQLSLKNSYLAWRELGLSDVDRDIRQHIFEQLCFRKNLIIYPAEPTTNKILQDHLGVLPPFRAPAANAHYRAVASALSRNVEKPKEYGL